MLAADTFGAEVTMHKARSDTSQCSIVLGSWGFGNWVNAFSLQLVTVLELFPLTFFFIAVWWLRVVVVVVG